LVSRKKYWIVILLLSGVGCVEKSPTSPPFEYAGEWLGKWTDYSIYYVNTGNPLTGELTLTVEEDGSASAGGTISKSIGGFGVYDRIVMNLTVLPDGLVTGNGEWGVNFMGYTLSGEGEVIGQLDSENENGSGALLVELNGTIWHLPWHVTRSK